MLLSVLVTSSAHADIDRCPVQIACCVVAVLQGQLILDRSALVMSQLDACYSP